MRQNVRQGRGRRTLRLLATAAAVVAILASAASPATAQTEPRVTISELSATRVSLLATGFARQATVEFTVTIGSCTGRLSMVAAADALVADFEIAPPCTGAAVATASGGAQSAARSFVVDNPRGVATAPPAGSASEGAPPTGAPAVGTTTSSTPAATSGNAAAPVSYTHLTLPTTPYV